VLPNPLAREARITFALARTDHVVLDVLDVEGRRVRTLRDGWLGAGMQSSSWDARDDQGRRVTPGIYWLRMRWTGGVDGRRIVRLD
jgi:flagellar hook assembly protein FlgD